MKRDNDMHGDRLAANAGDCPATPMRWPLEGAESWPIGGEQFNRAAAVAAEHGKPMPWQPMAEDPDYAASTEAPSSGRICCDGRCMQGRHCPLDGPIVTSESLAVARQQIADDDYQAELACERARTDGLSMVAGIVIGVALTAFIVGLFELLQGLY